MKYFYSILITFTKVMVITSDVHQKTNTYVNTNSALENEIHDRNSDTSCNSVDCIFKPISRCTICLKYCCYVHASQHTHSMDNFEILK